LQGRVCRVAIRTGRIGRQTGIQAKAGRPVISDRQTRKKK
jgi:hypothetical protein